MIEAEPFYATQSDIDDIKNFYHKFYPDQAGLKTGDFFDWMYLRNPCWENTKLPIIIIRSTYNNEIIGHEGLFRDRMKINNVERTVTWGTDLFVHPDFRGQGIARKIHTFIHKNEEIYLAIAMAVNTRKLLSQFNFESISPVYSYVAILNKSFFENQNYYLQLIKNNFNFFGKLAHSLNSKYDFSLDYEVIKKYFFRNKRNKGLYSFNISRSTFEDAEFLNFRMSFEKNHANINVYSKEIINWKFVQQPDKEFKLFLYTKNWVKGYVILRIHKSNKSIFGVISDFAANSLNVLTELICFAKQYCKRLNCNALFVLVSDKKEAVIFKDNGFFLINKREPLIISNIIPMETLRKKQFRFNYESHDLDRVYNFRC